MPQHRHVAQLGSAPSWGVGGRRFKSFHADQIPQQNQSIRVGFVVCGVWLRCETGWDEQECRDAIQHNFNAWIKEFGTGNKEHQQIIEQTEGFLNAYGLSRFAPLPYDPQSLPIRDLAGYRDKGKHDRDVMVFYTFPAAFEGEMARGFNVKHFAKSISGRRDVNPTSKRARLSA